ncbi:MAG: hypothetical protein AAGM38_09045 [Pseudomonadota bacterium]
MLTTLILQDDPALSSALSHAVTAYGFEPEIFASARAAWDRLQQRPVDLVIASFLIKRAGGFTPEGALVLVNKMRMNAQNVDGAWMVDAPDRAWMGRVPVIVTHDAPRSVRALDPERLMRRLDVAAIMRHPLDCDAIARRGRELVDAATVERAALFAPSRSAFGAIAARS